MGQNKILEYLIKILVILVMCFQIPEMLQIISVFLCRKIKFLLHILDHRSARYLSMSLTLLRWSKASTCFPFAEPEPANTHADMMFHWTQMQSYLHEFVLARLGLHKERYLALIVYFSYSKFLNDLQSRLVSFSFYENRGKHLFLSRSLAEPVLDPVFSEQQNNAVSARSCNFLFTLK